MLKTVDEKIDSIKNNFTIIHTCVICKKRISTFWSKHNLVGDFIAGDVELSETLDIMVPYPDTIKCYRCYYRYD